MGNDKLHATVGIKYYYKRNSVGSGFAVLDDGSCYYLPPFLKVMIPSNSPVVTLKIDRKDSISHQRIIRKMEDFDDIYNELIGKLESMGLLAIRQTGRACLSEHECKMKREFFTRYTNIHELLTVLETEPLVEMDYIFGEHCFKVFKDMGVLE